VGWVKEKESAEERKRDGMLPTTPPPPSPFFVLCRWVGGGAVVSERTAMREMKMEARTRRQEAGRTKVHRGKSIHRGIPKMRR